MANHYIRTNEAGIIVHGFSDSFESPVEGDICITTDGGRHYNPVIRNDRGQFIYMWNVGFIERSQADLEDEWESIPKNKSVEEEIDELRQIVADLSSLQLGV